MSTDCGWIESQMEGLLSDDPETERRVGLHVADCRSCRTELEGYEKLDRLLAAYVHQKAAAAAGPRHRFRPVRAAMAGAGLAVALLAVWLTVGGQATAPVEDSVLKAENDLQEVRAKPDPAEPSPTVGVTTLTTSVDSADAENFQVTDAAGYFYSLEDFSDAVLILGVFDQGGHGVRGFERISETYRSIPGVRLLAVSTEAELQIEGAGFPVGFPMMTNRDSTLMGTPAGQFSIIGRDGTVHRRGSLDDRDLHLTVSDGLEELGVAVP